MVYNISWIYIFGDICCHFLMNCCNETNLVYTFFVVLFWFLTFYWMAEDISGEEVLVTLDQSTPS